MLNSYKKQHKMLLNILKKGIPFAIGIGLLNILMDSADGAVISHKKFITEYVIKSLVTGLLFGTIMTLYNRYKENKRA
jgi:hypothetical protein